MGNFIDIETYFWRNENNTLQEDPGLLNKCEECNNVVPDQYFICDKCAEKLFNIDEYDVSAEELL